jgi:hypothetical protein
MTKGKAERNLARYYDSATRADKLRGRLWYPTAQAIAKDIAERHALDWRKVALAIAALSPRCDWDRNISAAWEVAAGKRPAMLRANVDKALALLSGAPSDTLRGVKVRPFAAAILGKRSAAVVDAHMLRAAGYTSAAPKGYKSAVKLVQAALRSLARKRGEYVADCQAIIWEAIRSPQRELDL